MKSKHKTNKLGHLLFADPTFSHIEFVTGFWDYVDQQLGGPEIPHTRSTANYTRRPLFSKPQYENPAQNH